MFLARLVRTLAVYAAARCERKMVHPILGCHFRQADGSPIVHVCSRHFELSADRIVRDSSEMDERINILQEAGCNFANVAEMLLVKNSFRETRRSRQAMRKITCVNSDELRRWILLT